MRAGAAFVSTDVETGHTEVHLYVSGKRYEVALELGEHNWHALHRAFDESGAPGAAHFEPMNVHVTPHHVLIESYECITQEVAR